MRQSSRPAEKTRLGESHDTLPIPANISSVDRTHGGRGARRRLLSQDDLRPAGRAGVWRSAFHPGPALLHPVSLRCSASRLAADDGAGGPDGRRTRGALATAEIRPAHDRQEGPDTNRERRAQMVRLAGKDRPPAPHFPDGCAW